MATTKAPPWKRRNPKPKAARTHLTPAQKAEAKAAAARAGRRYPNLVDNMRVAAKTSAGKKTATKKTATGNASSNTGATKKAAPKKAATKKAATKTTSSRKAAVKKAAAKKTAAKSTPSTARKRVTQTAAARKP